MAERSGAEEGMSATRDIHTVLPFAPRAWQRPLIEDRARNIVAVVHRRAGKSTAFIWRGLRKAMTEERLHIPAHRRNLESDPPRVVHVLPAQVSWQRTGLWDKVALAAQKIPGAVAWKSVFRVELPNGGVYQCGGMDKPDSWRGGYADEVIEDEADDVIASGLDMVVEPMLSVRQLQATAMTVEVDDGTLNPMVLTVGAIVADIPPAASVGLDVAHAVVGTQAVPAA
jgi:hypothetical protein